jgi:oxygen-independent coproporphyrinogen-3 oxidase
LAGIYIHIPFCRKACHYCNFHFSTNLSSKALMVAALVQEAGMSKDYLQGAAVGTIYLGGGTPSLLSTEELRDILQAIGAHHSVEPGAEITLEANPDDISAEKIGQWKEIGINRLSIGVQSFRDADLQWMNRAHQADQARMAIITARNAGFLHDSIDLIYGIPGLSDADLIQNLEMAISLGSPHLSCYALTVEQKTALAKDIQTGKMPDTDPQQQARQFLLLIDYLTKAGYEHYEISNFALPGHRSRHNSSYWQGIPYLGLGPSAHSFNGKSRRWNTSVNARYLQQINAGILPFEEEQLSPVQQLNEYLMTSLRTLEGMDLKKIITAWGEEAGDRIHRNIGSYLEKGKIYQDGSKFILTKEGKLFADGIASDLFFEEGDLGPRKY